MRCALLLTVMLLAVVIGAAKPKWHQLTPSYSFAQYQVDFRKTYKTTEEYENRRALFQQRLKEILLHNGNPASSYKKGINHMSDWTEGERKGLRGAVLRKGPSKAKRQHKMSGLTLPISVDYRDSYPPVLTAVKDQGQCGSCWAHAATESIESAWARKHEQLYVLSQQQITSCTPNPNECGGTGGCGGNIAEQAFEYILGNGGISQEWVYPYESYWGVTPACTTQNNSGVVINGYTAVRSNDADAVLDAVTHHGPLAISVDASSWPDYESGIFTGCNYAKNISMDHAVQLIGFGHDSTLGLDYWLVRNSWSPGWGENGFIRLVRYKEEQCGWNVDNQNGSGCKNGPSTVWACGECGIAYDTLYVNVDDS